MGSADGVAKMKKLLGLLGVMCMTFGFDVVAATAVVDGITWNYYFVDGEATIGKTALSGDVVVPESLNGYPVKRIGGAAFQSCSNLTSVVIPSGVTRIEYDAIRDCPNLKRVVMPDGLTGIGGWAFLGCRSLTDISLPTSVTNIGNGLFYGCTSLTNMSFPEGVERIGNSMFHSCSNLTSVSLPMSVTNIGNNAFRGCTSLKSVSLPSGVTKIDDWAFGDCRSLTEISLPGSVMNIGNGLFAGCVSLTSLSIPEGVTNIGTYAFADCRLTRVTLPNKVLSVGNNALAGCRDLETISIPWALTQSMGNYESVLKTGNGATIVVRYPVEMDASDITLHANTDSASGKIRNLSFRIPVTVTEDGAVSVRGTLVDADGNVVATAQVTAFHKVGDAVVFLSFKGEDIRASGLNGPYSLVDLHVSHAGVPNWGASFETTEAVSEAHRADDFISRRKLSACIPTEGLVYQLDASNPDAFVTNSYGEVIEWCSNDGLIRFELDEGAVAKPYYDAQAFGGLGAVVFGSNVVAGVTNSTRLATKTVTTNQTVFIVNRPTVSQNSGAGIWGMDCGNVGISGYMSWWYSGINARWFYCDGEFYLDGVRLFDGQFDIGKPQIVTAVSPTVKIFETALGNYRNIANDSFVSYYRGEIAEIIVYNRKLSDAERVGVELYLKRKWTTGEDGLAVVPGEQLYLSPAQSNVLEIVAFSEWQCEVDQPWVMLSQKNGTNTATIGVSVAKNETGMNRTAVVRVSSGGMATNCVIVQYGDDHIEHDIDFKIPQIISDDHDVVTDGTLKYAYAIWHDSVVNGVSFKDGGPAFETDVMFEGVGSYGGFYGSGTIGAWGALSSNYKAILTSHQCCGSIILRNLELGKPYLVQIWSNNSKSNVVGKTLTVTSGRNSRTLLVNSTDSYGGVGQYVVGYFTADATTKRIELSGNYKYFNALQVRELESLPETRWQVTDSVAPRADRTIPFADTPLRESRRETVTVQNNDLTNALTITNIQMSANGDVFKLEGTPRMPYVVQPGANVSFTVVFDANEVKEPGDFEADISIKTDDLEYPLRSVQVQGKVVLGTSVTFYVDAARPDDTGDGRSWRTAKKSIQAALANVVEGDEVVVTNGVYDAIEVYDLKVRIRSVNGSEQTIIDGSIAESDDNWYRDRPCATLTKYSDLERSTNVVLCGFTLRNGQANRGGGAMGGTLESCVLYGNVADNEGGGAIYSVLKNCSLVNNSARIGGGARDSVLTDCSLVNNSALIGGGGACDSVLTDCSLVRNWSESGGGVRDSTLDRCTLRKNMAQYGGGGAYFSTLNNCVVYQNRSYYSFGGGASDCTLNNCTVVANLAYEVGGTYYSEMNNCIVWGNMVENDWYNGMYGVNNCYSGSANHSCIENLNEVMYVDTNAFCTAANPCFVDSTNGVFLLRTGSPCVDAGTNAYVVGACDLAGNPRVQGAACDMGAYEGATNGVVIVTQVEGLGLIDESFAVVPSGGVAAFHVTEMGRPFAGFYTNGVFATSEKVFEWSNVSTSGVLTAKFEAFNFFVDARRPDDAGDGLSWATAKRTINAAVAETLEGDVIWVTNGVYDAVSTGGKAIEIRSVNGAASTIIDGGGRACCADLADDEGFRMETVLAGFTLRNGFALYGGAVYGGTLNACILIDNEATERGGGAYSADLNNCFVARNKVGSLGGGCYGCTLRNCTVIDNVTEGDGGGIAYGSAHNSIIWANVDSSGQSNNVYSSSCDYCCTSPARSGTGNITQDPRLVDAVNGDGRLRVDSPCRDMGNAEYAVGATDVTGAARIQGGGVDLGAYEGNYVSGHVISGRVRGAGVISNLTAVVVDGGSATFYAHETIRTFKCFETNGVFASASPVFTWEDVRADGVITAVFENRDWYVDASCADDTGDGRSWSKAKRSIQAAIDAAVDDERIYVWRGVYAPIQSANKAIRITGVNGRDVTIIDGGQTNRCATLGSSIRHEKTILDGLTLRNGKASEGGGVRYGTLTNCVLTANFAEEEGGASCYATLIDCVIYGNSVSNASSAAYGGASYYGTLKNCVVSNNVCRGTDAYGGGLCGVTTWNCLIVNNMAISSTTNTNFWARGGGAYRGTLYNCTIVENTIRGGGRSTGAGVYSGSLYNCILWENRREDGTLDNSSSASASRTCSTPLISGTGNIAEDPQFIDAANGDYRIYSSSPCIDAGTLTKGVLATDLVGNARVVNEKVDMGAYENPGQVETPVITPADGTLFEGNSQKISISCATAGAVIRYTLDGSEPTESSAAYVGAFNIKATTTVTVKAFKEGIYASAVAAVVIHKRDCTDTIGLAEALDVPDWTVQVADWRVVTDVTHDGSDAARSGTLADGKTAWFSTTVSGKGRLGFWWKVSCEDDPDDDNWDHMRFLCDGVEMARLDGITDWKLVEVELKTDAVHLLRWEYVKDASDAAGEDCAWVDQVVWQPETSETTTTEVPVPYTWLDRYGLVTGGDYEGAGNALGLNGYRNWESFVAGLNPTNTDSKFVARIEMVDGVPVISWTPDLGADRRYITEGVTELGGKWTEIKSDADKADKRFFRVRVVLPK